MYICINTLCHFKKCYIIVALFKVPEDSKSFHLLLMCDGGLAVDVCFNLGVHDVLMCNVYHCVVTLQLMVLSGSSSYSCSQLGGNKHKTSEEHVMMPEVQNLSSNGL